MQAVARVTGTMDPAIVESAARFGAAYGMAPAHAALLEGTLTQLTSGARPMLRGAAAARSAFGGRLPMGMEPLQEEIAQMAGFGGAAAPVMDAAFFGQQVGLIGGMGQRYRLPGQAAEAFGRFAGAMQSPSDPTTNALRTRAVLQHAARHGPMLDDWHRPR